MMLAIPDVLSADELSRTRALVDRGDWRDGRITAGHQSARVKRNLQLAEECPAGRQAADIVLDALSRSPIFISAALPRAVFPPLFNRYVGGGSFGSHIDSAIRVVRGSGGRVRTDLSATLFLSDPGDYDGGELVVRDSYGQHAARLPAGHMVLYPAGSVHHVTPVTRGDRTACFFWVQSMVRDDAQRSLLFELDGSIQSLTAADPDHPEAVRLTGIYHNLLRLWAEV